MVLSDGIIMANFIEKMAQRLMRMTGAKYWFQHGKLHRLDGPAVECSDIRLWYQNGVVLNSEFIRMND